MLTLALDAPVGAFGWNFHWKLGTREPTTPPPQGSALRVVEIIQFVHLWDNGV